MVSSGRIWLRRSRVSGWSRRIDRGVPGGQVGPFLAAPHAVSLRAHRPGSKRGEDRAGGTWLPAACRDPSARRCRGTRAPWRWSPSKPHWLSGRLLNNRFPGQNAPGAALQRTTMIPGARCCALRPTALRPRPPYLRAQAPPAPLGRRLPPWLRQPQAPEATPPPRPPQTGSSAARDHFRSRRLACLVGSATSGTTRGARALLPASPSDLSAKELRVSVTLWLLK